MSNINSFVHIYDIDKYNPRDILTKYLKGINFQDGIVIIKPNLISPISSKYGCTTDLKLVQIVIDYLKKQKVEIVLAEGPGYEFNSKLTFKILKINEFIKKNQIELINLRDEKTVEVKVPSPLKLKSIKIPKIITKASKIINMPKFKTHMVTRVTFAMKNLFGILPDEERRRCHVLNIEKSIVDLNKVIKPELNIVDAIYCMHGQGPVFGNISNLNKLIISNNTVACDIACCKLIGISYNEIEHIKLGKKSGLVNDFKLINLGEKIKPNNEFLIPTSKLYPSFFRIMWLFDLVNFKFLKRKKSIIPWIYAKIGTRLRIDSRKCNKCSKCEEICPIKAINIKNFTIDNYKCVGVRCLQCIYICDNEAIAFKGFSKPKTDFVV